MVLSLPQREPLVSMEYLPTLSERSETLHRTTPLPPVVHRLCTLAYWATTSGRLGGGYWGTLCRMATSLTQRQQQVLDLFLSGKTYREVAEELGISPETVNPTLKACARKLGTTKIARGVLAVLVVG